MLRGITIAGGGGGVFHPPPYFNSAHGYFSFDFFLIIRIVSVRRKI